MKIAVTSLTESRSYIDPTEIAVALEGNPKALAAVFVALAVPQQSKENPLGQCFVDIQAVSDELRNTRSGREVGEMLLKIAVAAR